MVSGGPDGDVSWLLCLADGTVTVIPGDGGAGGAGSADLDVVQDYTTAAAISQGQLSPAAAFAAGRLRLGGRVGLLARHGSVVAGMGDVFASLREATDYPPTEPAP